MLKYRKITWKYAKHDQTRKLAYNGNCITWKKTPVETWNYDCQNKFECTCMQFFNWWNCLKIFIPILKLFEEDIKAYKEKGRFLVAS